MADKNPAPRSQASQRTAPVNRWHRIKYVGEKPTPRVGQSAAQILNVAILFGGLSQRTRLNDLWMFNTSTAKWHRILPDSELPQPRSGHTSAIHGSEMLVFGGENGSGTLNDFWAFDLQSETWSPIIPSTQANPIPAPRCRHAAVSYGNKMIIYGGQDSPLPSEYYSDMHLWDTHTRTWSPILYHSQRVPCGRAGHTFTLVGSDIYLFGGFGSQRHLKDLWVFNAVTLQWREITPKVTQPTSDSNAGEGEETPKELKKDQHIQQRQQERQKQKQLKDQWPTARSAHSAFAISNSLFIFGGYAAGNSKDDVWEFDTISETWVRHAAGQNSLSSSGSGELNLQKRARSPNKKKGNSNIEYNR
ncbi:MAG: putative kelch repeat protein [Streblomastix strix]|uniref:Putative kelch repeat protein n=1 Tax=Streblomastix strix TaxID=222440 RepID=A0A5J4X0Z1_9EUKA|nr:MAG: putative kelch repeat protein [Streblomastix strix]